MKDRAALYLIKEAEEKGVFFVVKFLPQSALIFKLVFIFVFYFFAFLGRRRGCRCYGLNLLLVQIFFEPV